MSTTIDYEERDARIIERVKGGDTYASIANDEEISRERVRQIVNAAGVQPGLRRGKEHPHWKGGRHTRADGTILVLIPDEGHPRSGSDERRAPEHELILEEELGRRLKDGEYVWHKDGDRSNNERENLELISLKEARKRWAAKQRKYSRETLLLMIRWVALDLGRTPSMNEATSRSPVAPSTFYTYFDSYTTACAEAGLEPNQQGGANPPERPLPEDFWEKWGWLHDDYYSPAAILGNGERGESAS